jgi:putative hemolysin
LLLISAIILLVLILISGVFASSEIAVSSSNRNKLKIQADEGDKRAKRLLATLDEPNSFFATTQLYYTFITFFCGAFAASVFTEPLVNGVQRMGLPVSETVAEPIAFVLVTAVLTYVSLILGELVPKRIALRYATPFALWILPFLHVLALIALPFVKLLSVSATLVLKLIGFKEDHPEEVITREEVRMIVEASSEHGQIAENEQGMIENIFNIESLTAADICTHRLDVVALPLDADFNTVLNMLTGEYYSRVPIYEESLDNICGILYTKDVLRYMTSTPDHSGFKIKALMREVHFVPLSKKADELFQEMRKERAYMAVVLDERGGTMGIVTMEDLVEKIVGSIQDEYDADELPAIVAIDKHSFRIQGTTDLEVVQNYFGVPLPIANHDTLSGFLVGQLGYIPSEDDKPTITWDGLHFQVERVQKKRIATVTVTKSVEKNTAHAVLSNPTTHPPDSAT